MKKLFFVMAAALFVLAGCTQEEMLEQAKMKGRIQASLEQGKSSSRMTVGEGNALSWTVGDSFVLFSQEGTEKETWKLVQGEGETEAFFTGNQVETPKGAAYPAWLNPTLNGTVLTMNMSEKYHAEDATCDMPMWANVSNYEHLVSFTHLCALLKVDISDIPEGYNQLIVEADKPLAGEFSADISKGGVALSPVVDTGKTKIDVYFDAISSTTDNDRVFYLPLPVNNYGLLRISISNGSEPIVLNEWKDRSIQRAMVYWTSLTHKVSDAKTASEVTAELQGLTAAAPKTKIIFENAIDASQPIVIPAVEGNQANVSLIFEEIPATSSDAPLTFTGAETTTDETTDLTSVSFPADENQPMYMTVDMPQNTFTVESGYYATVISTTAAQTLIIEKDVVVEHLIVKGGNVEVYGTITGSITRDAANPDAVTKVANIGGTLPDKIGEGIQVISSDTRGSQAWYVDNIDGTEFELSTLEDLVGFVGLLNIGTSFEGKTIKLANDIDMFGYTFHTNGMLNTGQVEGFRGTFDGQGYAIHNLNIRHEFDASINRNISVGLIPTASLATIKNVTIKGGKVYVPTNKAIVDGNITVIAAPLLGLANGCIIENCHNQGCEVVSDAPGYVGGIVGRFRKVTYNSTPYVTAIMACSNTATIKSNSTAFNTSCTGGITGGGWGQNGFIVGCYNTGEIIGLTTDYSSYAAGIAADIGGLNYMYGCFNDAPVSGAMYCGDLGGQVTYSGYYRYSCYTGELFGGQDWTNEDNRLELHQCTSYEDVVSILNAGIVAYNADEGAPVRCDYRYVQGTVPAFGDAAGNSGENSDVTNGKWDE